MNTNLETNWLEEATADLLAWRSSAGAWPYYQDREEATEPTCLAAFALSRNEHSKPSVDLAPTAQWLSLTQQADGAIGISRKMPVPAWPTSMAVLTWRLLKLEEAGQEKAIRWLLGARGTTTPRDTSAKPIVGHDTTIVGWPWVPDTHSWIEPTALTMLALRYDQAARTSVRFTDGVRLILDRAISSGGWNYGNTKVFGNELRPHPAPTGLVLLTLSCLQADLKRNLYQLTLGDLEQQIAERVHKGRAFLERVLPTIRAPISLAWGIIGLRATGAIPADTLRWLEESYGKIRTRSDRAMMIALLLLASDQSFVDRLQQSP